jgi:hypothetical protein
MKPLSAFAVVLSLLLISAPPLLASGTSTPPPVFGGSNVEAFQYESSKARVVAVDARQRLVVVREEKKKKARDITLKVDAKTSLKAGKEKIQLAQLAVGTLVKVAFDRAFNAVAIKVEKEKT